MSTALDDALASPVGYAIDPTAEEVFPLADLPANVPVRRGGRPLHKSIGFRWAKGMRAADGANVALPTVTIGGAMFTSRQAFAWWVARLSAAPGTVAAAG